MVKIHDPVVMRVFPAPHTERAYFLWLAKRLGWRRVYTRVWLEHKDKEPRRRRP